MQIDVEDLIKKSHATFAGCTSRYWSQGLTPQGLTSYQYTIDAISQVEGNVLDLCCGDGLLLEELINKGRRREDLFGVDLSRDELNLAMQRLPGVDLRLENARRLNFPEMFFSAVASHFAIMLIPKLEEVLVEISRVLKFGGLFVAVIPGNDTNPLDVIYLDEIRSLFSRGRGVIPPSLGDARIQSDEGVKSLFSFDRGFRKVEITQTSVTFHLPIEQVIQGYMNRYYAFMLSNDERAALRSRLLKSIHPYVNSKSLVERVVKIRRIVAEKI